MLAIEVDKSDWRRRTRAPLRLEPAPGQAVARIDGFALTSNNVTYAAFGEAMGYWRFWPASDPSRGIIPVWGFGTIIASRADGVAEGARFYGYWPSASHALLTPGPVRGHGFTDVSAHRQGLAPVYNSYVPAEPGTDEAMASLLRPLFATGYLLAETVAGDAVIATSASSKTALAMAWALRRRGRPCIGLTSAANLAFVRGTGLYERVLSYAEVAALTDTPGAALVDFAGNPATVAAVHAATPLAESWMVGATDYAAPRGAPATLTPPQRLFFAPDAWAAAARTEGPAAFDARLAAAQAAFIADARRWLRVEQGAGADAYEAALDELLDSPADPAVGRYLSLWPALEVRFVGCYAAAMTPRFYAAAIFFAATPLAAQSAAQFSGSPPLDVTRAADCAKPGDASAAARCVAEARAGVRASIIGAAAFALAGDTAYGTPAESVGRLQRLADAGDAPAAYLLGARLALGDGRGVARDRPRGRALLEVAARGGNIAAMDLLGTMLIEGFGGPVDVARGVALWRRASAAGFPTASYNLMRLYAEGRRVPQDAEAAAAALEPLAAAGDEQAKAAAMQLRMTTDPRITNVQLVPRADGPPEIVTRKGAALDAIPSALGFTPDFRAVWARPLGESPAIAADLRSRMAVLPTPFLYELARRAGQDDASAGRQYLFLALSRNLYDLNRCTDRTGASDAIPLWLQLAREGQPPLQRVPPAALRAELAEALRLEATLPANTRPWWQCWHGVSMMNAAMGNAKPPELTIPPAGWPAAREKARTDVTTMVERLAAAAP